MKKTLIKLLIAVLVLTSAIGMLASCSAEKYTVKIMDGTTAVTELTFEKGDAFSVNAAALAKTGYDYVGLYTDAAMTEEFTADVVEGNLTLYAKYTAKAFSIFVDTGIDGAAEVRVNVTYDGQYALAEPSADAKPGYRFNGFTYMGEAFAANGTYAFTHSITVKANWAEIPHVTVMNGNTQIDKFELPAGGAFTLDAVADTDANAFLGYTGPAGFTATYNEESGKYDCTYTGSGSIVVNYAWDGIYYITIEADGVVIPQIRIEDGVTEYALPTPTRDNYTFVGYTKNGVPLDDNSVYTLVGDEANTGVTLTVVWQKASYGQQGTNDYFLESVYGEDWYVFLTKSEGTAFNFPNWQSLEISNNEGGAVAKTGTNSFTALKPGTFTLTRTAADGTTRTYKCRVEVRVTEYDEGTSTVSRNENNFLPDENGVRIESFLDAGITNFIPDLTVKGNLNGAAAPLGFADIPYTVKVEYKDGTEWCETTAYTLKNGAIDFDATLLGCEVRLTLVPKYALSAEKAAQTVTMLLHLNNGTNVYTNDELYAAYGALAVKEINILRTIKATLNRADVSTDAKDEKGNYIHPINTWDHSVYTRILGGGVSDTCRINGNYYTIDGGDLPVINPENPGGSYNGMTGGEAEGFSYKSVNVQLGLFLYYCNQPETITPDMKQELTITDLYITSNNTGAPNEVYGDTNGDGTNDSTTTLVGSNVLRATMAFHGIVMRNTTLYTDKVTIKNARSAYFNGSWFDPDKSTPQELDRRYTNLYINRTITDNLSAHSVYSYAQVGLTMTNSELGQSGGATFHFDDTPLAPASESFASMLYLDETTTIENYAMGTEPWFIAYSVAPAAAQLKTNVPAAIANVNSLSAGFAPLAQGYGIDNPLPAISPANMLTTVNGNSVFNFIAVVTKGNGTNSTWAADTQGEPYLKVYNAKDTLAYNGMTSVVNTLDAVIAGYGPALGDKLPLIQGAREQFNAAGGFYYATFDGKLVTKANAGPQGVLTIIVGLFD